MPGPTIDGTGFNRFGLAEWVDLLTTGLTGIYGAAVDIAPESPDGQWTGILAEMYADLEELVETAYNSRSISGASGAALSRLVKLIGITRQAAQKSTAPITMTGTAGTVIPIGSLIASASDPTLPSFETIAEYTIGGGGTVTGTARCMEAGAVNAIAGDLTVIKTQVTNWTAVTNTSAATPGRQVETDARLRGRHAESVAKPSQSMVDSLRAAIADLDGVDDVEVYENDTGAVDGKGLPAHSINAIIDGGDSEDIADAMFTQSSMGVTKVGAVTETVVDAKGNPHTMRWDVPDDVSVYVTVVLSRTPNSFEIDAIKNAVVNWGVETSRIGRNVPWGDIFTPINDLEITGGPGLPSITALYLGDAEDPTLQSDLVVAYDARPRYHVDRVIVEGP